MTQIFNRELIESFTKPLSEEIASDVVAWTQKTLDTIIDEIRKTNTAVTDSYEYELAGDFITETTTMNSEIDLYIVLKSPQLELNSIKLSNNKFKQFWLKLKRAYLVSKDEKMSKRKRKKQQEKMKQEVVIPPNKYSVSDFKMSLLKKLINYIDDKSYIFITSTGLKLVAREFLGIDVNIYPVFKNDNSYKLFHDAKGKFITFAVDQLHENIDEKIEMVGENYNNLVRVYKNLYFNLYNYHPSQFFIESLIYNCPNSLFFGYNFFEVFIKSLNYLSNASLKDFVLVTDTSKKLFSSARIQESIVTVMNLTKQIDSML